MSIVDLTTPFNCPICDVELYAVMPGIGPVSATIVIGTLLIAILEGVISWTVALFLGLLFPFVRFALFAAIAKVFGPTVEPLSDGRLHLGNRR